MSRIGKKSIVIPSKVEVSVTDGLLLVKGPAGELSRAIVPSIDISVTDNTVVVTPQDDTLESRALWGTYASHIRNMIQGVEKPFEKKLILEGIGYRVEVKGDTVAFALGFSHPVNITIPKGLKVAVEKNNVTISGISKDDVGEFTARLRDLKKPEPYKGKGLRYDGEVIKMKQGKKSA